MNIAFFLGHPAHFHLFKYVAKDLQNKNHNVFFVIKKKDILEDILQNADIQYTVIGEGRMKNSKSELIKHTLHLEKELANFCKKNRIDILAGSTLSCGVRFFTKTKILITGEDDYNLVPLFTLTSTPFCHNIITPISCKCGIFEYKALKYNSFQKLAYLHPKYFTPDIEIVKKYFDVSKPYFLIRFAKLAAYHDTDIQGFSTEKSEKLFKILEQKGNIFITSERELEPQFEKYRLKINPLDIHHIMAFADLYIGDSQSMAVEAAMLGTPSVRFNDFAGRIGVLEELEHKYGLTFGIKSAEPEKLYKQVENLLNMSNIREEFQTRRQKMLAEKIDVTAFFSWLFENYPKSRKIMKQNPDYQYKFK